VSPAGGAVALVVPLKMFFSLSFWAINKHISGSFLRSQTTIESPLMTQNWSRIRFSLSCRGQSQLINCIKNSKKCSFSQHGWYPTNWCSESLMYRMMNLQFGAEWNSIRVILFRFALTKRCWTNSPIISGCLKIWSQFRIHFEQKQALASAPILANINLAPSLTDPSFQLWRRRGIKCVMDLFKGGHFISFEQLKKDFSIPQSHFFSLTTPQR